MSEALPAGTAEHPGGSTGGEQFSGLSAGRSEGAEGATGDGEAGLGGKLREEGGKAMGCSSRKVLPLSSERA